jgi:hypothetical protein
LASPALSSREIERSDQNRAICLKPPRPYFLPGDVFDLFPVLLKTSLKLGWIEGHQRSSPILERCPVTARRIRLSHTEHKT